MRLLCLSIGLMLSAAMCGQGSMFDVCPIKNSQPVPEASVFKMDGEEVDIADYIGERPAVIVFYRGGWCSYCTSHLSELNEINPLVDSLGYELIAITPDDFSRLDSSVVRGNGVSFQIFSDKNINAIDAFGIGWKVDDKLFQKYKGEYNLDLEWWNGTKNHILPVPSVFVVRDGVIQYQHVDPKYSQRLAPKVLLSFIDPD